ncbi:hypothetical protein [Actinomadura flavalba]|uniref:Rv1733c family protein n=1 Tax=Actinomadura flavalba TaxID=1120938 RepID=UPI0003789139|nr:hypothetical protein [Actinomadura flavalba]
MRGYRRPWRARLGLYRSPLRRPVDRVQRRCAAALLALALVVALPLASLLAARAYATGKRAEAAERAARTLVLATAVDAGATHAVSERYYHASVKAIWPVPGGAVREGTLPAWKDAGIGDTHPIWVDEHGAPAVKPRPHSRSVSDAGYAASAALLAVAFPAGLAYWLLRRRCDRRRAALWDAAWSRLDSDAGTSTP